MYGYTFYGYDVDGNKLYAVVDMLSDWTSFDIGELYTSIEGAAAMASYMNGDEK